ncbi:hypothetical protein TWF730_008835 [Orbilia blumenaviensis]|uniref:Uncharacterized protein n=1 Tax=Orbilia blumenaviensis TaxID=1796055 RepID=A0AAV9V3I0_9PEZI
MAPSSSLEDSESSDSIQSSASPSSPLSGSSSSSSSGGGSAEERRQPTNTTTTTAPTSTTNDHDNPTDEDSHTETETEEEKEKEKEREKEKKKKKWTPYTTSQTSVYTASSSLLTISSRPLSQQHSKPASADEILFHNPPDPNFILPETVKTILEDEELLKQLPDSDLLKAVHLYVAEFYGLKKGVDGNGDGKGGWGTVMGRAMDESALLAVGVILEEYCREMLGRDGDLVLAEREDD